MNSIQLWLVRRCTALFLAVTGLWLAVTAGHGQNVQHLTVPFPGGLPGFPVTTGIDRESNRLSVTWDGPPGYYQLFQKAGLKDSKWLAVGKATNLLRRAFLAPTNHSAFFRVAGPAAAYAGSQVCLDCHAGVVNSEIHTAHAGAFTNAHFAAKGGQTNAACLACHTVGYGLPTGFAIAKATPSLQGVQCENCHGPAANHAANPGDPVTRPRVEVAATVCGGCHNGPWHPTYSEWQASAHSEVVEDLNATNRIDSCGRCHSGSVRLALLHGDRLPLGDANIGVVCITCHDPHQTNSNPAQLRNPVASTNDYFLTTSAVFTSQYQSNINLCAQCHNHRGAVWTDSTRAPHRSPQYNVLLGTVGELDSGLPPNQPAAHALLIQKQCVGCHMQKTKFGGAAQPAVTGHQFTVDSYAVCQSCHTQPGPLVQFVTGAISNQIVEVKAALDLWAARKAPAPLGTKYGARAWEYTTPGDLSVAGPAPSADEQALLPVNIRKARFNLYLVYHDGSYGVHNGPFSVNLLGTAYDWVVAELNK